MRSAVVWSLAVCVIAGCAQAGLGDSFGDGAGGGDAVPGAGDLSMGDSAIAQADLQMLDDQRVVTPPDQTAARDLTTLADLTALPDQTALMDLSRLPDLTARPDLAPLADLKPLPDLVPPGKTPGQDCTVDAECASMTCRPVLAGGGKVCVSPCATQADCLAAPNLFCEATSAGARTGQCIPRSPAHCAACARDADCGSLAERCIAGPGDTAPACHVDCALGGAAACPSDYACAPVVDGNVTRSLCVPKPVAGVAVACLDALGGFCDRVPTPLPCARANAAGTCSGMRACLAGSLRFDKCGAATPQLKATCATRDPAGCTEMFAPGIAVTAMNCGTCGNACAAGQDCCNGSCTSLSTAVNCGRCGNVCGAGTACCNQACTPTNTVANCGACGVACGANQGCCGGACVALGTPSNCAACGNACAAGLGCCAGTCAALDTPTRCGACGNVCPGQTNTSDALCVNKACDMTCRGENYDVDQSPANGCEVLHPTPPGPSHDNATAYSLGSHDCNDGQVGIFNSALVSDSRVHNPAINAFNGIVGSAPDVWTVFATGAGGCYNNYGFTVTTLGGGGGITCYMFTLTTNKTSAFVQLTGVDSQSRSDTCSVVNLSCDYNNNTPIYMKMEKICSLPVQEVVSYTVSYHL